MIKRIVPISEGNTILILQTIAATIKIISSEEIKVPKIKRLTAPLNIISENVAVGITVVIKYMEAIEDTTKIKGASI